MPTPELWIIAGPNGAGKTTFVGLMGERLGLPVQAFINPDAITLEYLQAKGINTWHEAPPGVLKETFIQAANDSQALLEQRIEAGGVAVIETVLSTEKYCALAIRVVELGGRLNLVYVALDSPEVSKQRVALRASRGGHDVPENKLELRWKKSLELLPWFAVRSTSFWLFDNSTIHKHLGAVLMASGTNQLMHLHGVPSVTMRPLVADFISSFSKLDSENRWRFDLGDSFELI